MMPDTTQVELEPYIPPAMLDKLLKWSVFLSFRGEDTRHIFTEQLRDALKSKGLTPFMDDQGMDRGDVVQPSLDEAILQSSLVVAIFSPRYADSRWCLNELSRIFQNRKRVIPVFYQVLPSDVQLHQGLFGKGFQTLFKDESKALSNADFQSWRIALNKAGNTSGYLFRCERCMEFVAKLVECGHDMCTTRCMEFLPKIMECGDYTCTTRCMEFLAKIMECGGDTSCTKRCVEFLPKILECGGDTCAMSNSNKAEVIRRIVQQVWSELRNPQHDAVKLEVGLHTRVDKLVKKLDIHSTGVRFLGIHGIPGIGKTTLANAVFNKLVGNFKYSCFISNVRENLATQSGLLSVKNKIIKDLFLKNEPLAEQVEEGKRAIERILLVLDDVFEAKQLHNLGINRACFKDGSRIIITSRNVDVLHDVDVLHEAVTLDETEALELFSIHALGRRQPTEEFCNLSQEIVLLMDGLPLALEVFGSFLVNRGKKEWEDALLKLKDNQQSNLEQVIKLSYDGLDNQDKTVFLDVSCLLLQLKLKKEDAVDILAACDRRAELAIGNLVMRSLLKITDDEHLWMHDQIRDMGRKIVQKECLYDTGNRSRLWDSREIKCALSQEKVTEAVSGIVLDIEKPPEVTNASIFTKILTWNFKGFTSQQRPEKEDISNLNPKWFNKMVHLKLLSIDYAKLQGDFKPLPCELRFLRWRGCPEKSLPGNLPEEIRVLDLSGSNLERLWSSDWLYWGFNKVVTGNLVVINLSCCPKLSDLPDMSRHRHLKKLILEHCVGLTSLHDSIGKLSSIVHLNLRGCTNLANYPRDVTGMKSLEVLILSECSKLRELPDDVRSMKSLIQLYLDGTSIAELPKKYVHYLTKLQVLNLNSCCQIVRLPDCLGSLTSLRELSLSHTNLVKLPDSIGLLTNLEKLSLNQCSSLAALPDSLRKIKSLTEIQLKGSSTNLHSASICSQSYLKVLT